MNRRLGQDLAVVRVQFVGALIGRIHLHIAFTAVQNHLFVENRYAVDGDGTGSGPAEQVQSHVEKERHIHGVKALVKRDGLQIDIYRDHVHVPDAYVCGAVHQRLPGRREQNSYVLEAILIGIVYLL